MLLTNEQEKLTFKQKLDNVSTSFCLAKWLQVTMHLHSGHNHSCHHPNTHKTPLEELKFNPSSLHNTCFKKDQRLKMKNNSRPSECGYCWNIEDLGGNFISDRVLKSSEFWAVENFDKVVNLSPNANINPTYAEVSFSNVCNFRCSYCSGNFSTRWKDDIRQHGSYTTKSGEQTMEVIPEDENPYVKAFWEWWPELVQDLKVFRITGGEPLLSKNTFRVLEDLSKNPRPQLEVAINSNLGASDAVIEKFIAAVQELVFNGKVKSFRLFTSVEAWGAKAEYIRNGLEFPRFQKNLEKFLKEVPGTQVTIMATYNSLSVTSFTELLVYVKSLKEKYTPKNGACPLFIDISYLRHPLYQTVQVLPESYQAHVSESLQYMKANESNSENPTGFFFFEVVKMQRIFEWMKQGLPADELPTRRKEFYLFFSEHDQRRDTNFLEAFPEMKEFWDTCKSLL